MVGQRWATHSLYIRTCISWVAFNETVWLGFVRITRKLQTNPNSHFKVVKERLVTFVMSAGLTKEGEEKKCVFVCVCACVYVIISD